MVSLHNEKKLTKFLIILDAYEHVCAVAKCCWRYFVSNVLQGSDPAGFQTDSLSYNTAWNGIMMLMYVIVFDSPIVISRRVDIRNQVP